MAKPETENAIYAIGAACLTFAKQWLGAAVIRPDHLNCIYLVTGVNAVERRILIDGYWMPIESVKMLAIGANGIDLAGQLAELRRQCGVES